MMNKRAITLIEVILVTVILAVLSTLAIPRYTGMIERTHAKRAEQTLLEMYASQQRYYIDNDVYAIDLADLDIKPKGSDQFKTPFACSPINGGDSCTNSSSIAEIHRDDTNPSYVLGITNTMVVGCTNSVPSDMCARLGF